MYISFVYMEPFSTRRQRLQRRLDRLELLPTMNAPSAGAADHEQLDRLKERAEMPARQREAAEDRTQAR